MLDIEKITTPDNRILFRVTWNGRKLKDFSGYFDAEKYADSLHHRIEG